MSHKSINASLGRFAAELGLSRDELRRVLSQAGVQPAAIRGRYPVYRLADVYRTLVAQLDVENLNPHARLALARAIQVEDAIRRARGETVAAGDMATEISRCFKLTVQFAGTLPDILQRDAGLRGKQLEHVEKALDRFRIALYEAVKNGDEPDDE